MNGSIGYPLNVRPRINRQHVDGPVLILRDGRMHWLTLAERVWLMLGLTNAEMLEAKWRYRSML